MNETPSQQQWERLVDEENLSRRRREAEKQLMDLSGDQVEHLRRRAKNDLYFLANGLLGYKLLSPNLHGHLSVWGHKTRDARYRMLLLPRGHYKSTLFTIAESVQMALPNVGDVATQWPYVLGPNIKMLIAHENREESSRFLFEIAQAFMEKPMMLALFPECVPSNRDQRINKWELELPRDEHHREPTFDTIGTGGSAQGRHYNHIKLDDIIGKKQRDSETRMRRAIEWFENVESLLTRVTRDGWDLIGTRWSYADVYSKAMELLGIDFDRSVIRAFEAEEEADPGEMVVYARGAVENNEPIFPAEFTMPWFERKRKSPWVWAAQYANNPKEGALLEFRPGWLQFYNVAHNDDLVVFREHGPLRRSMWDLDRCILCDPSVGETEGSDETGIVVTGTDDQLNVFILETVKKRMSPPELIDKLIELYLKYSPRILSIEEVVFSATYKYWFQRECADLGIHPSIYPYKPGSQKTKEARIRGLTNYFAAGQVYISQGMFDFRDEYEQFPMGDSDHLLDAMAQGPEVWSPGLQESDRQEHHEAERKVMEMRDALTGY